MSRYQAKGIIRKKMNLMILKEVIKLQSKVG